MTKISHFFFLVFLLNPQQAYCLSLEYVLGSSIEPDNRILNFEQVSIKEAWKECPKKMRDSIKNSVKFKIKSKNLRQKERKLGRFDVLDTELSLKGNCIEIYDHIHKNESLDEESFRSQRAASYLYILAKIYGRKVQRNSKALSQYKTLMGWELHGLGNHRLQKNKDRESSSFSEQFAHDFIHYLHDKDFPCARPASKIIFDQFFNLQIPVHCKPFQLVPLSGYTQVIPGYSGRKSYPLTVLDPEHILDIDYILVKKGKKISQKFGHSLLKLTFCPPQEDPEDCRASLEHQVVISYRALMPLFLESPDEHHQSQAQVIKFRDILLEYQSKDNRELQVQRLRLDCEQKKLLVNALLEKRYIDERVYHLWSQNCAGSLVSLLNVVLKPGKMINLKLVTPYNLLSKIRSLGLLDGKLETIESGAMSWSEDIEELKSLTQKVYDLELHENPLANLKKQAKFLTLDQRSIGDFEPFCEEAMQLVKKLDGKEQEIFLNALMNIENSMIRFVEVWIVKDLLSSLEEQPELTSSSNTLEKEIFFEFQRYAENSRILAERIREATPYGIPTMDQVSHVFMNSTKVVEKGQLGESVALLIQEKYREEFSLIARIDDFVKNQESMLDHW